MLDETDPEDMARRVRAMKRSVSRMTRLVEDLLDESRLARGQLSLETRPHECEPLVNDVLDGTDALAREMGLEVAADVSPETPPVIADRTRIEQVFTNLIGNAMKFSPPNGRVRIGAEPDGSLVRFWVRDEGPGIPPGQLPNVFEPYWQAAETRKLGSGLGLGIAKGIIEAHGGRIWVESRVGEGTTFFFTLPACGQDYHPAHVA